MKFFKEQWHRIFLMLAMVVYIALATLNTAKTSRQIEKAQQAIDRADAASATLDWVRASMETNMTQHLKAAFQFGYTGGADAAVSIVAKVMSVEEMAEDSARREAQFLKLWAESERSKAVQVGTVSASNLWIVTDQKVFLDPNKPGAITWRTNEMVLGTNHAPAYVTNRTNYGRNFSGKWKATGLSFDEVAP